jgi:hypothetical protein
MLNIEIVVQEVFWSGYRVSTQHKLFELFFSEYLFFVGGLYQDPL